MYPRNAASPERIAIGAVVQISDGAVQTSGVSIKVKPQGTTASAGGGTTSYEEGIVEYLPTQAETNYTSFEVIAYKTGCIPVATTIVTTASATPGYAGVDWSKVTAPTTTLNLSGTTIKTATDVEADTADIQGRIPAALVSGRIDASVGAMAANVLTATAIAADAITDAKVASDVTIASVTGAVGSVTGAVGSVTGAVGSVTGNVGGHVVGTVASVVGAVGSVTGNVGGNVGGNVTGSVGSVATGGITRASLAADTGLQSVRSNTAQAGASTSITLDASASATTDFYINHLVLLTGGTGAGQARYITAYNGTTKVATVSAWATNPDNTSTFALLAGDAIPGATAPSAATIADAVWDEILSGHAVSGSTGEALAAAGSAGDPWITALPGSYTAGQAGYIVGTNLDATVGTRATQTSVNTIDDFLDTEIAAIKAKTDNLPAAPAATGDCITAAGVRTAVGLASANLDTQLDALPTNAELATALGTSDDATLAAIAALSIPSAATIADAVWDEATSGHVSAGSTGLALGNTDLRGSRTVIRGTSASGASTTSLTPSALSPAGTDADQFKGRILVFDNDTTTAALRGQATDITASSAASLAVLTFTALTTAPASGDTFSIV